MIGIDVKPIEVFSPLDGKSIPITGFLTLFPDHSMQQDDPGDNGQNFSDQQNHIMTQKRQDADNACPQDPGSAGQDDLPLMRGKLHM
jgi:hypothetical protein